ncbi:MAG: GAF domain-containing protein, partial [Gaiellaceae bacterium]
MTEIGSERFSSQEEELRDRLRELAAVYRMAETAVAADDLEAILDEAVETLIDAVGVDRASVLLYDDEHVMRFRAWRGLSDEYRAAVEGHSPWTGEEREFAPIAVADVNDEPTIDEELRRTIAREGIRSLAFVPLVHRRELLGKFMLYHDEVHDFTAAELKLAQTIASTVATAAERARAEQTLRESSRRLDVVFRRVADGLTVQDPTGKLVFANDAAARMAGYSSAEELLSTPVGETLDRFELLDEHGAPLTPDDLPGRLALRGIDIGPRLVGWRSKKTGDERWSLVSATPVHDEEGRLELVINIIRDVTDRRRQEQRLSVLARAGEVLAESLDVERTLAEVARLSVPAVGDWCMVYVQEPDGQIRRM